MKVAVEWDCVKCGLVYTNVDLEDIEKVKCPVCGTPRKEEKKDALDSVPKVS